MNITGISGGPANESQAVSITVSNSDAEGTGTASGVSLNDPLPSGNGVNWSIDSQDGDACSISGTAPQVLSCDIGTMVPGAVYHVHITSDTAFASCTDYPNTASVSVGNEDGGPFTSTASTEYP